MQLRQQEVLRREKAIISDSKDYNCQLTMMDSMTTHIAVKPLAKIKSEKDFLSIFFKKET